MSGCVVVTEPTGAFCARHQCYLDQVDHRCRVQRLTTALAERDRCIVAALALLHHPTEVNGCMCLAHQIAATLRGDSDG